MSQPATHDHGNRTRNGNGSFRRDLEHVERDAEACRLASMGWSYSKIAAELGYADKGAAYRGVQKVLVETARSHGTETLRQQQLAEMTELRRRMWEAVDNPPPMIDRVGRIVKDGDGRPVPDIQAQAAAAAVILRAAERVARLRGLDAARKTAALNMNVADVGAVLKMAQDEVERMGKERAEDSRQARLIAATVEPPDME